MVGYLIAVLAVGVCVLLYYWPTRSSRLPGGPLAIPYLGCLGVDLSTQNKINCLKQLRKAHGDVYSIRHNGRWIVVLSGYDNIHNFLVQNYGSYRSVLLTGGYTMSSLTSLQQFNMSQDSLQELVLREIRSIITHMVPASASRVCLVATVDLPVFINTLVRRAFLWVLFGDLSEAVDNDDNRPADIAAVVEHLYQKVRQYNSTTSAAAMLDNNLDQEDDEPSILHDIDVANLTTELLQYYNTHKQKSSCYVGRAVDLHASQYNKQAVLYDLLQWSLHEGYVATVLQWAILYCVNHPVQLYEIQEELDRVQCQYDMSVHTAPAAGEHHQASRSPWLRTPVTDATLREVQRVTSCFTYYTHQYDVINDVELQYNSGVIPEGTKVICDISTINNDPQIWSHPESFQPLRFLNQHQQLLTHNHYVTHGLDPSLNPTMEHHSYHIAHTIFSTIIRHFNLSLPYGCDIVDATRRLDQNSIIVPERYRVRLQQRNTENVIVVKL